MATDKHGWLRSRAKTPVHRESDEFSDHGSISLEGSSTPRRKSRPKLPNMLSYLNPSGLKDPEPLSADFWAINKPDKKLNETVQEPIQVANHIFRNIMQDPFAPLSPQETSNVMQVIEAYRSLYWKYDDVEKQLKDRTEELRKFQEKWERDEPRYQAEIKRLEILIANGKDGIAAVLLAREESVIDRRGSRLKPERETANEFFVRERAEDDLMRISQRVLLNPVPYAQPELTGSHPAIRYHEELPFGSPPSDDNPRILTNIMSEDAPISSHRNSNASDSLASEFSSFGGDPLPDEIPEHAQDTYEAIRDPNDFRSFMEIATRLAERRSIHMSTLYPRLMEMFFEENDTPTNIDIVNTAATPSNSLGRAGIEPDSDPHFDYTPTPSDPIEDRSMNNASSTNVNLTADQVRLTRNRSFSFNIGDDSILSRAAEGMYSMNRSVTTPVSPTKGTGYFYDSNQASPVLITPETSDSISGLTSRPRDLVRSRRPSKIPSPVQGSPMAQPRRESSTSSILTVVRHSQQEGGNSGGGRGLNFERDRVRMGRRNLSETSSSDLSNLIVGFTISVDDDKTGQEKDRGGLEDK